MKELFMTLSSVFYWASFDIEFPYPTKISMDTGDFVSERAKRKNTGEWHGKAVDEQLCLDIVQKHQKPLYVFKFGYEDATAMMVVELSEVFEVPHQTELI
jgi:hypothetical protein